MAEGGASALLTVFYGPFAEVLVLRAKLEDRGILVFLEDEMLMSSDPFVRGANPLAVRLRAPAEQKEAILAVLEESGLERRLAAAAAAAMPAGAKPLEELNTLGRRIRWAALCTLTAPIAVIYGLRYLRGARHLVEKAADHGLTLIAIAWSLPLTAFVLFVLAMEIGNFP